MLYQLSYSRSTPSFYCRAATPVNAITRLDARLRTAQKLLIITLFPQIMFTNRHARTDATSRDAPVRGDVHRLQVPLASKAHSGRY